MPVPPPAARPDSPATIEEGPRKDKNFRRYASNVERALSLFDTALQEWADYIAFLGRLLKALQSKPSDTAEIPHKATVAKRLAQCLDPRLPSGVHQKTLDVYAYVFAVLGSDGLSRDLPLYLPGLSPTLSFASLSVKPALLSLFETFIVSINPIMLRPALKAIVLSLLPGLEEETSEEFERTLALLNKFRNSVGRGLKRNDSLSNVTGDQYFWQSLFLASITGSSRRVGALAYMTRELPRLDKPLGPSGIPDYLNGSGRSSSNAQLPPEIEAVTSPEPGLLVRCFAAGLQDEQLLVQRGFLDLLVTHLPLQSILFHQKVASGDLELLVAAASSVVVRREMSLNRRLWTWFLGPEPSSGVDSSPSSPGSPNVIVKTRAAMSQTEYFELYGTATLVRAILEMFNKEGIPPSEMARPYRICLSLMDRWEVGSLVIPRVFLPAMESVWRFGEIAPSREAFAEVLRSANVFFDGIESSLIWAELVKILVESLDAGQENRLDLALFVITNFNIKEEEMLTLHMPLATLALMIRLRQLTADTPDTIRLSKGKDALLHSAFKVATQLLDLIPQRVLIAGSSEPDPQHDSNSQELESIQGFYQKVRAGAEDATPPLGIGDINCALRCNASLVVVQALDHQSEYLEPGMIFLEKWVHEAPGLAQNEYEGLMSSLLRASNFNRVNTEKSMLFSTVDALVSTAEIISKASLDGGSSWNSDHRVRQILPGLLTQLWAFASPSQPKHNVEAVRGLWRIHSISPDSQLVEGSIATLMFESDEGKAAQNVHIESARRFATVWAHTGTNQSVHTDRRVTLGHSLRNSSRKKISKHNQPFVLATPLLLLLDSLLDTKTEVFVFVAGWLQSLSSLQRIVEFLIYRLRNSSYIASQEARRTSVEDQAIQDYDDTSHNGSESVYYLQMISDLIKHSNTNVWASLKGPLDVSGYYMDTQTSSDTGPANTSDGDGEATLTVQIYLAQVCMQILGDRPKEYKESLYSTLELRRTSVLILRLLAGGQSSTAIAELRLDVPLLEILYWSVEQSDIMLQMSLMDLLLLLLNLHYSTRDAQPSQHRRMTSRETVRSTSQLSLSIDRRDKDGVSSASIAPPPALLDCLIHGISSSNSHPIIDHWIRFLDSCLPFYASNAFQAIMPLVDCFTKSIELVFQTLRSMFEAASSFGNLSTSEPISILNALLNGLEQVLARGHDQLLQDEGRAPTIRSPEQVQGFFGNMVSGVFAPEAQTSRTTTANNRLTVLLCFKDAVRVCFSMWSWGDVGLGTSPRGTTTAASFNYTSLRLRNRTRRMLEHLLAAEALECLETLVEFWHRADLAGGTAQSSTVFNLLHALEGSRPKYTIPALFNAIYSRTNPNVLDPVRKSTLTSELSDVSLATFLAAYTRSMEDDALDEIWVDCMTFLKDVLGNPLPQRQTLPILLEFTAILGDKIDNTNFGEQRKMRRDIGELFVRLLAATFTTKPLALSQDPPTVVNDEKGTRVAMISPHSHRSIDPDDVVAVLAAILPRVCKILVDTDRIAAATMTISTQILIPTFKWKAFPSNVTSGTLDILKTLSRIPEASKTWRKDVGEAFNDSRFFSTSPLDLILDGWMPVLRQWVLQEKERIPELLSRISSPTSAGIMFGVGASSARLEADRKTQLNLRRVVFVMLSTESDTFIVHLGALQEKLVELMTATAASSPSSATRAEVYMVLRALVLKNTPVHLSSLWPIISTELYNALSTLSPTHTHDMYSINCVIQAAKLLDTLLTVAPDDFQLREWLFVTDTIDAVYRPSNWEPVALVDGLAEVLDSKAVAPQSATPPFSSTTGMRKPLLTWQNVHEVPKESVIDRVLRPFLRQLSINAFESTYRMEAADQEACVQDLLQDVFDDSTMV